MIEYVLCYATSFFLGTMFGMFLSYKLIQHITGKEI
jgi:hypothetical protein